jgi:hypothetical protein
LYFALGLRSIFTAKDPQGPDKGPVVSEFKPGLQQFQFGITNPNVELLNWVFQSHQVVKLLLKVAERTFRLARLLL